MNKFQVLDYSLFFYIFLFAGLTILWNIHFAKRIMYFVTLYRESVETANNDTLNNYTGLALHYKVEIVKYIFLLTINITEISSVLIFLFGVVLSGVNPTNATVSNCSSKIYNTDLHVFIGIPMETVFISVGHVGLLYSLALVICLMKYLDATYRNINEQPVKFIQIFMTVSCMVGVLLFIAGSIYQSFILEKLIY